MNVLEMNHTSILFTILLLNLIHFKLDIPKLDTEACVPIGDQ